MAKKQQNSNDGFAALKQQLKAKVPARLYVFYGEETFLLNYYLERLKKQLVEPVTEAFNYRRITSENWSMDAFCEAAQMLPMMAEHTLLQVDDIDLFKLPEAERDRLGKTLQTLPEYATVIFTYLTVAWKPDKRMKKLWEAISGCGTIVEFGKQEPRELATWAARHFAAHEKRIAPELCLYLVDRTGGTMTELNAEIEKICAFSGAPEICRADIDAVTEPVLDAVVFEMTDRLCTGEYGLALDCLTQLLQMQSEPIAILGAISSSFRRLSAARILLDRGQGAQALRELLGLWDRAAWQALDQAKKVSSAFLRKASALIALTDYQMKTSYDDKERLLEQLLLTLSQEARNA